MALFIERSNDLTTQRDQKFPYDHHDPAYTLYPGEAENKAEDEAGDGTLASVDVQAVPKSGR